MSWLSSLVGDITGSSGSEEAARIAEETSDENIELIREQNAQAQENIQPILDSTYGATTQMADILGLDRYDDGNLLSGQSDYEEALAAWQAANPEPGTTPTTPVYQVPPTAQAPAQPQLTDGQRYLQDNPGVAQYYQDNPNALKQFGGDLDAAARFHYDTFGQGEGRSWGAPATDTLSAPTAGTDPKSATQGYTKQPMSKLGASSPDGIGMIDVGDGRFMPTTGGNQLVQPAMQSGLSSVSDNPLYGTPMPVAAEYDNSDAAILARQDNAYMDFENSGYNRSMTEVDEADLDQIRGQSATLGKAFSGSSLMAMAEQLKQNENTAFMQYVNGVAGAAGQQQQAVDASNSSNAAATSGIVSQNNAAASASGAYQIDSANGVSDLLQSGLKAAAGWF